MGDYPYLTYRNDAKSVYDASVTDEMAAAGAAMPA